MKPTSLLLPLLLACCPTEACEGLVIERAWIREAPPGARVMAGYAELRNDGASTLVVDAVESSGYFDHVMIHETLLEEGRARMVPRDTLEIPPGATLSLAPGGLHLMLMQPVSDLALGAEVPLTLRCGEAVTETRFPVSAAAP
ncbi:MAG: copper chaperone PCu(A)C [Gammaproteobacteria bacterium]|nr:copper chaperone PCu(A)C [Gammaproteobacteria bacterium]